MDEFKSAMERLKIYSEVRESFYKVFDFYKKFMLLYGNELSNKIDRRLNILSKLEPSFLYNGDTLIRKLLNKDSSYDTWIGFLSDERSQLSTHYVKFEIYEKILSLIELNEDGEFDHLSKPILDLLYFINELIDKKTKELEEKLQNDR